MLASMKAESGEMKSLEKGGFLGVVTRVESYLGLLYLLLSFPLGVFYFTLILVWFFMGLGLSVIAIGIPILGLLFMAIRAFAGFERNMANWFLDAHLPTGIPNRQSWRHPWSCFKALLADSSTWKGVIFLLLKFPLGIISFVVCVVLIAFSLSLIATPLLYRSASVVIFYWRIDAPEVALLCLAAGLAIGLLTLHLTTALAAIWRGLASALLRPSHSLPVVQLKTGPIIIH
jgi:hypothetical protein